MYDAVARDIVSAGWANQSFGSVQESGHFALLIIEPTEIDEIMRTFEFDLSREEVAALAGYYIVREDSQGLVWLTSFDTKAEAEQMFKILEAAYQEAWGDHD